MRRFPLLLAGALLVALILPSAVAAKPPATGTYSVPITQAPPDAVDTINGAFTITRFATQNGGLVAIGTFTGTVTDAAGTTRMGTEALTLPVSVAGTTCAILHLTLGPLDLNLLGLAVHLNQVVLNIDAQSGPGNLLGNLLCAVAHLLDGTGPLGGLAALLNQILAILQGLGLAL
jgi:hypothetical protein